jgi:hypothetical protein
MVGYWASQNTYSAGTLEMCYVYSPKEYKEFTFPDMCQLLNNTKLNPCDALPDTLGPYKKKSAADMWQANLAFKDWCQSFTDKVGNKDKTIEEALTITTIGGNKKEDTTDSHFGTEKEKEERKAIEDELEKINSDTKGKAEKTLKKDLDSLNANGKGHIVKDIAETISQNSKDLSSNSPSPNIKPPYQTLKEYNDGTHLYAQNSYEIEKNLFFPEHLKLAEDKFNAINQEQILSLAEPPLENFTIAEKNKIEYIEHYIENKDGGYRKMAHEWAAKKAQEEIKYELPDKLGEIYVPSKILNATIFGVSGSASEPTKKYEMLYKIKKQQYYEAQIMKKWKKDADTKADELKKQLTKLAVASRIFNITQARKEIEAVISSTSGK